MRLRESASSAAANPSTSHPPGALTSACMSCDLCTMIFVNLTIVCQGLSADACASPLSPGLHDMVYCCSANARSAMLRCTFNHVQQGLWAKAGR